MAFFKVAFITAIFLLSLWQCVHSVCFSKFTRRYRCRNITDDNLIGEECCKSSPYGGYESEIIESVGRYTTYKCKSCKKDFPHLLPKPPATWVLWGPWLCEEAYIRERSRSTTNEKLTEKQAYNACPNKVDGGWGNWSNWTTCSKPCGVGYTIRVRSCNTPTPKLGGDFCIGNHYENKTCIISNCTDGGWWAAWSPWSQCSLSCGGGISSRARSFHNYGQNMDVMHKKTKQIKECNTQDCPDWGPWSRWTECIGPSPCSNGTRSRVRECKKQMCAGENEEIADCVVPCPVDGGWTSWTPWSCIHGQGIERRYRMCHNPRPENGGKPCRGIAFDYGLSC